jgi:tRNA (guanine26-N2/guanine27-N2)-dimethyltransferase
VTNVEIGGPIWKEPIHDLDFVEKLLEHVKTNKKSYQTSERLEGILTVISEVCHECRKFIRFIV